MYLFVYGTLLSAIPSSMAKFLRRRATLVGPATTTGTLYDLGMYPGFQVIGTDRVCGELYQLEESRRRETLEMLDSYEGVTGEPEDEYRHENIPCRLAGGREQSALTYVLKRVPKSARAIPGGDYAAFFSDAPRHQRFVAGG